MPFASLQVWIAIIFLLGAGTYCAFAQITHSFSSSDAVVILRGHSSYVSSVSWSPDGSRLASGSGDKTIRIWDPTTGVSLKILREHKDDITSISWSPDGTKIASVSAYSDNTVRIWDASTGTLLKTWRPDLGWVRSISWSPDGTRLALGADNFGVFVLDATTGLRLMILSMKLDEMHSGGVTTVSWSPDGSRLASGSLDDTVRIWDSKLGQLIRVLRGHTFTNTINSVAWNSDGVRLASASGDGKVRVWDSSTGALFATLEGPSRPVKSVSWSPDRNRLAAGSSDGIIYIWDSSTRTLLGTLEGHTNGVKSVSWSPDGTKLASGSESPDNTVRIWDTYTGSTLPKAGAPEPSGERSTAVTTPNFEKIAGVLSKRKEGYDKFGSIIGQDSAKYAESIRNLRQFAIDGLSPSWTDFIPAIEGDLMTFKGTVEAVAASAEVLGASIKVLAWEVLGGDLWGYAQHEPAFSDIQTHFVGGKSLLTIEFDRLSKMLDKELNAAETKDAAKLKEILRIETGAAGRVAYENSEREHLRLLLIFVKEKGTTYQEAVTKTEPCTILWIIPWRCSKTVIVNPIRDWADASLAYIEADSKLTTELLKALA